MAEKADVIRDIARTYPNEIYVPARGRCALDLLSIRDPKGVPRYGPPKLLNHMYESLLRLERFLNLWGPPSTRSLTTALLPLDPGNPLILRSAKSSQRSLPRLIFLSKPEGGPNVDLFVFFFLNALVYIVDHVKERLALAASIGAIPINFAGQDPVAQILAREPHGVMRTVNCVGMEALNSSLVMDESVVTK
ncbi:alcohol dehydrogenase GroES-like domain-containing protein [Colletotrichum nymphaeae SA-01]|uniref:Alcohol dehydrogenase GroES-like domain-containing protein n=1 Tax=Colletotrichum nymphaeae SA-01 TaxID=1460502 RepID=A0A135RPR0_9PEZI|nr:alcohol dehydrogenase GroES-like domain-containing protein [Colletotrichum nymphaeae SA-01]